MKDDNYTNIILEEVREQYNMLQEGMDALLQLPPRIERLESDMQEVKADVKIIKLAVRQNSCDINVLKSIHPGMEHA